MNVKGTSRVQGKKIEWLMRSFEISIQDAATLKRGGEISVSGGEKLIIAGLAEKVAKDIAEAMVKRATEVSDKSEKKKITKTESKEENI